MINGKRFYGTPVGNSPISPDSCAPTTLKYLRAIPLISAPDFTTSYNIFSLISLVYPYGQEYFYIEASSVTGISAY